MLIIWEVEAQRWRNVRKSSMTFSPCVHSTKMSFWFSSWIFFFHLHLSPWYNWWKMRNKKAVNPMRLCSALISVKQLCNRETESWYALKWNLNKEWTQSQCWLCGLFNSKWLRKKESVPPKTRRNKLWQRDERISRLVPTEFLNTTNVFISDKPAGGATGANCPLERLDWGSRTSSSRTILTWWVRVGETGGRGRPVWWKSWNITSLKMCPWDVPPY